jgi:fatty-acid peroxygenase
MRRASSAALAAHDYEAKTSFPRTERFDETRGFLAEGYEFIGNRCRGLRTDAFETRLFLRRALCMVGADAAALFYGGGNFTRKGAILPTTPGLLGGKDTVQSLDGPDHRRRKELFLAMLDGPSVSRLVDEMELQWRIAMVRWAHEDGIVLHDRVQEVLCRAVMIWAGVPCAHDVADRTRELAAIVEDAGALGPRVLSALLLRTRCEHWARRVVAGVRAGTFETPVDGPLARIAGHRGADGEPLPVETAARELINVLRPTVAVSRFIVFAALALHRHPAWRDAVATDPAARLWFVQEVRRFFPFFPAVGGRALRHLWFRRRFIEAGTWVLLDLYGTNHHPRLWEDPHEFRPERFRGRRPALLDLVPQGAGVLATDHRCPGEEPAIALMSRAATLLAGAMDYRVPPQNLHIDLSRLPALPATGLVLSAVRAVG